MEGKGLQSHSNKKKGRSGGQGGNLLTRVCIWRVCFVSAVTLILFGFFQLSPKKTWEGFIGGFFSTVVFGFIVSFTRIFI